MTKVQTPYANPAYGQAAKIAALRAAYAKATGTKPAPPAPPPSSSFGSNAPGGTDTFAPPPTTPAAPTGDAFFGTYTNTPPPAPPAPPAPNTFGGAPGGPPPLTLEERYGTAPEGWEDVRADNPWIEQPWVNQCEIAADMPGTRNADECRAKSPLVTYGVRSGDVPVAPWETNIGRRLLEERRARKLSQSTGLGDDSTSAGTAAEEEGGSVAKSFGVLSLGALAIVAVGVAAWALAKRRKRRRR